MARRRTGSDAFLDELLDLLRAAPWWFGPIVIGFFYVLFAWIVPALCGAFYGEAERGTGPIVAENGNDPGSMNADQ